MSGLVLLLDRLVSWVLLPIFSPTFWTWVHRYLDNGTRSTLFYLTPHFTQVYDARAGYEKFPHSRKHVIGASTDPYKYRGTSPGNGTRIGAGYWASEQPREQL